MPPGEGGEEGGEGRKRPFCRLFSDKKGGSRPDVLLYRDFQKRRKKGKRQYSIARAQKERERDGVTTVQRGERGRGFDAEKRGKKSTDSDAGCGGKIRRSHLCRLMHWRKEEKRRKKRVDRRIALFLVSLTELSRVRKKEKGEDEPSPASRRGEGKKRKKEAAPDLH